MSWQDDAMIEQDKADALWDMGEAEWKDMFGELTVGEAIELNERARLTCEWETTTETENNED